MATISVCMIVKDEEANLTSCLDCLYEIADEIIIVDTGSKDKTKKIAENYTNLIYDYVWINDFAAARNYAFSLASMEYIYSADADERIDKENLERFKILKEVIMPEIEIVQMRYSNQLENGCVYNFDEEYRPKLFRRLRNFRWISPIHETIAERPLVFDSDIVIGHYPKEKHSARDFATFVRTAENGDMDKRLWHMYAMELYVAGSDKDFEIAEKFFAVRIDDNGCELEERMESRCVVAHARRVRNDGEGFYEVVLEGVMGELCAEICCEIGEFYFSRRNYAKASMWFSAAKETNCILLKKANDEWPTQRLTQLQD